MKVFVISLFTVLSAAFAFCPKHTIESIMNFASMEIPGGIYEEQVLDSSLAEDPDAVSPGIQAGVSQATGATGATGATAALLTEQSFPLRKYWWAPLLIAVLTAFVPSAKSKINSGSKTIAENSQANAQIQGAEGPVEDESKTVHGAMAARKKSLNSTVQSRSKSPREISDQIQSSSQETEKAHTRPGTVEETASPKKEPTTRVKQELTEISTQKMLEYAGILQECKGTLSELEYKALHAAFFARDTCGIKWTVNLKNRNWYTLKDGKWVRSEAPSRLYFSATTIDAMEKVAGKTSQSK